MEVPATFDQVSFDAWSSAGDDPICYTVQVSDDAASWRAIASGAGTGQDIVVQTTLQTARYIRVAQNGSKAHWWSIAEFNVYVSDEYSARRTAAAMRPAQHTYVALAVLRSYAPLRRPSIARRGSDGRWSAINVARYGALLWFHRPRRLEPRVTPARVPTRPSVSRHRSWGANLLRTTGHPNVAGLVPYA